MASRFLSSSGDEIRQLLQEKDFKNKKRQDAYHRRKHQSQIRTSTALIPREINMR